MAFADDRSLESLVADLGAGTFSVREQAMTALRQRGEDARPVLEKAAQSRDPEVRQRARELLAGLDRQAALEADPKVRQKRVEDGMKELLDLWKQKKWETLAERGQALARKTKDEPRFLYLEAEGAQGDKAVELRKKALALCPNDEAPHYAAAEMLEKLGRDEFAAAEWRRILVIPPEGDVYDVNALFRLGQIEARANRPAEAAGWMEKGLATYRNARGRGMAIAGASEAEIEKQIARLQRQAKEDLHLHIQMTVKDGKRDELRQKMAKVMATLTINVQPRELRIFDLKQVVLRYDADKQTLVPLLNGSACCKPADLPIKGDTTRVAVHSLDCYYIYEVAAAGGDAKQLARYELDYTVRVTPGQRVAAWKDLTATVNGKTHDWNKLNEGEPFDWLPEQFEIEVEGTGLDGQRERASLKVPVREPAP